MSSLVTPIEKLDQACGQFIGEFSLDPLGYSSERLAVVDDLTLALSMSRLVMRYRTPEEQQAFFEVADNHVLESMGNPSARISTYTNTGQMALYNYDRDTGLVVVNNYPFSKGETRSLRSKDADALGFSIATRGICHPGTMYRALTELGIERLTADIDIALREA